MKTKNPKNRHLLSLVSRGVALQVRYSQGDFMDCSGDWVLATIVDGSSLNMDFREKPMETSIAGMTIPACMKDEPSMRQRVWVATLGRPFDICWAGVTDHHLLFDKRLIYETPEQASAVSEALLKLLRDANPRS